MKRTLDPLAGAALLDAADLVQSELASVPAICSGLDYWRFRAEHVAAVDAVLARLAERYPTLRHRNDWNGSAVTLLGLRSSSTSGMASALRNWITRARATAARIRIGGTTDA